MLYIGYTLYCILVYVYACVFVYVYVYTYMYCFYRLIEVKSRKALDLFIDKIYTVYMYIKNTYNKKNNNDDIFA